jgi:predicted alpha/beta hydrolase family esterase
MNTVTTPSDEHWQTLWTRRCDALYKANITARYHRRRQRFFDLLDKATKAATVLLGASLLGESVKAHLPLVASAISGLGLLALVFGYGDRKQAHKELAEAALQLIARIEEVPTANLTDALTTQWLADHSRLNSREPPALKTLVILCEREQATANGHPQHVPLPSWHKRVLADWVA